MVWSLIKTVILTTTKVCTIIILSGCNSVDYYGEMIIAGNRTPIDTVDLNLETSFVLHPPVGDGIASCSIIRGEIGVGIQEENNQEIITYDSEIGFFQINLEKPQDVIVISVLNNCYVERPILLKVFYNYEEIPFRVVGSDYYDTEFSFKLDGGYQINIPIQLFAELEVDDYLNILTIGVFPNPEHFAMNDNDWTINNMFGSMFNFAVSYGGSEERTLNVLFHETPTQIEIEVPILAINQDNIEVVNEHGSVFSTIPNEFLQVVPEEIIELYFHFNTSIYGEESSVTDYLLVSMLDWQQINKNEQPYILIEARHDDMLNGFSDRGSFTVIMPDKPGFYEFVTFLVPNPTNIHDEVHMWEVIFSFPFTIEVVEHME